MKIKRGEPMIELTKEDGAVLDKLFTQISKAHEVNAGLCRLFTEAEFDSGSWDFKRKATATMSAKVLRGRLVEIRTALVGAERLLAAIIVELDAAKRPAQVDK